MNPKELEAAVDRYKNPNHIENKIEMLFEVELF